MENTDSKKSKNKSRNKKYTTESQICGLGTDPVWDDTELVKQFDEVLREWKQDKQFFISDDDDEGSESEEKGISTPTIGPWVSVENGPNDQSFVQNEQIPFLDDYEMMSLYNEALSTWKTERKSSH